MIRDRKVRRKTTKEIDENLGKYVCDLRWGITLKIKFQKQIVWQYKLILIKTIVLYSTQLTKTNLLGKLGGGIFNVQN